MPPSALTTRSLRSITRGAVIFGVGLAVMNAVGFVFHFILTQGLGVEQYGVYAYTVTIVGMILLVTNLGSDISVLKYIPEFENNPDSQGAMLGLAYVTSLVGGIIAGAVLIVTAPYINAYTLREPALTPVLQLFAIVVIVTSVWRIINRTFRGLERVEYEILAARVIRPILNVVCVLVAFALGLTFFGVMASLVVACVLACLVSLYFLLTRVDIGATIARARPTIPNARSFFTFSVPLTFTGGANVLTNRVDILLVGFLLSSAAVGVYNIALMFASALLIPLVAVNQLFPPVASRLHTNGWRGELNHVYGTITRWAFTLSLPLAVIVVMYRRELLGIFGPEFIAGAGVVVLILLGQLINSVTGPTNHLLIMTGHQFVAFGNKVTFGLLNVILTYACIRSVGLIGAGISTFLILAAFSLTELAELWYLEQLNPYSVAYVKPIIAGGAATLVMIATSVTTLDGLTIVTLGSFAGVLVYITVLYALGLEASDRRFFQELLTEYQGHISSIEEQSGF